MPEHAADTHGLQGSLAQVLPAVPSEQAVSSCTGNQAGLVGWFLLDCFEGSKDLLLDGGVSTATSVVVHRL